MDLVSFFVIAILVILGLSLLSVIIDTIKRASPMWKLIWMVLLLVILTGVVLWMTYPETFRKFIAAIAVSFNPLLAQFIPAAPFLLHAV